MKWRAEATAAVAALMEAMVVVARTALASHADALKGMLSDAKYPMRDEANKRFEI